jgi:hypothetical protein
LAHRHLLHETDTISKMELSLLSKHAGITSFTALTTPESDIRSYLDVWNEVYLDYCDAVAVFPATVGRMRDYCHMGMKQRVSKAKNTSPSSIVGTCSTFDARMLAGYPQLNNEDTWFSELKELSVLIVHPFGSSIKAQYEKHRRLIEVEGRTGGLFPHNPNALPLFKELMVLSPPVGNKGRHFHEVLIEFMGKMDALPSTFDIVLISSGAWGPLIQAVVTGRYNKSSVYIGGDLQLHFGVWGGRYKDTPVYKSIANNSGEWIWPLKEETQLLKENLAGAYGDYATPP